MVLVERNLRGAELSKSQRNALEERSLAAALEVPGVRSATRALSGSVLDQ